MPPRSSALFAVSILMWQLSGDAAAPATNASTADSARVTDSANPSAPQVGPSEPEGYWTGPINGPVPQTLRGGKVVRTQELAALLKHGGIVLVDVSNAPRRPDAQDALWLPVPHPVIPQSVWIAGAGLGEIPSDIDALFRDRLSAVTADNLDHPIVIYCHDRCWLSWNAAKRAISYGYRRVYWYPDGIEGWRAAGWATSTAKPAER